MNSIEIFSLALNIAEPWFVQDVKLDLQKDTVAGRIDIYRF
jgi:hypothetical protein